MVTPPLPSRPTPHNGRRQFLLLLPLSHPNHLHHDPAEQLTLDEPTSFSRQLVNIAFPLSRYEDQTNVQECGAPGVKLTWQGGCDSLFAGYRFERVRVSLLLFRFFLPVLLSFCLLMCVLGYIPIIGSRSQRHEPLNVC